MNTRTIIIGDSTVKSVPIGGDGPLAFIGGPCAIESRDHCLKMAETIKAVCEEVEVPLIFKACYDKDCRSSLKSFHGVGIDEGLEILSEIRRELGVPVTSDFSVPEWAVPTAAVVDLLQVPAYLCRQTSVLKAAAAGGKPVHLKKGQFMSPWNMKNSLRKLEGAGCSDVLLADRGTFFGYNMLVNDFRCFPIMRGTGAPVCFDGTHSIQMPTSMGDISGGQREFIPFLVRAAAACGIDALFLEVHDDPARALSDANTVLDIKHLKRLLLEAKRMHETRLELLAVYGEEDTIS
jgi:2-dehydro-3-deoxyphosphooctonate aldolase (KDO 8-P synthase)